jgi:hypothetical protein
LIESPASSTVIDGTVPAGVLELRASRGTRGNILWKCWYFMTFYDKISTLKRFQRHLAQKKALVEVP